MSTAYHSESDGQTEVINITLQEYLHAFAHTKQLLGMCFYLGPNGATTLQCTLVPGTHPLRSLMGVDPLLNQITFQANLKLKSWIIGWVLVIKFSASWRGICQKLRIIWSRLHILSTEMWNLMLALGCMYGCGPIDKHPLQGAAP